MRRDQGWPYNVRVLTRIGASNIREALTDRHISSSPPKAVAAVAAAEGRWIASAKGYQESQLNMVQPTEPRLSAGALH